MPLTVKNFREYFTQGNQAVNGWCGMPSSVTAEIMARAGFDMLTVDLQHGLVDFQTALTMLQAASAFPLPKFVRIPWNEPSMAMKCLDAGVTGIICPMINSAEEARQLVQNTRYAPLGARSYGPTRAGVLFDDYAARAGDLVQVFAMIETVEAFENREEILAVEGLSGVYVGPYDLTLSMGFGPVPDPTVPKAQNAIRAILQSTRDAGLIAGIHAGSGAMLRNMLDMGFDFASHSSDTSIFTRAVEDALSEARE